MNQRETVSTDLAQQNADLATMRRLYEEDHRRLIALERTVKVKSLAENTAREVELRERYGRLGMTR